MRDYIHVDDRLLGAFAHVKAIGLVSLISIVEKEPGYEEDLERFLDYSADIPNSLFDDIYQFIDEEDSLSEDEKDSWYFELHVIALQFQMEAFNRAKGHIFACKSCLENYFRYVVDLDEKKFPEEYKGKFLGDILGVIALLPQYANAEF